jgi:SAM-dependent methyltransferase
MSGSMDEDATRIWDARYEEGTHVGTRPPIVGDPIDYTQHKFLYAHGISMPSTGRLDGWITADVARQFLVPAPGRVLALGSGMAFIEETLLTQGYVEHIVAYEMSRNACAAAMDRVRGTPAEGRLEMRSGDVLDANLPDGAFDVVFVQAAVHHFERIDDMFALMHRVLKPDGLLLYDEYVGADHHQFPPDLMEIMNLLNDCLGAPYRFDALAQAPRERMQEPSLEGMLAADPSEGVHASRILPLTYRWFDVLQRRDYGGTILRPFFTGILPNFDWDDEKDQTVARLIILVEQLLLRHGVIPTYHTNVVARRRPAPLPPLSAEQEARIGYADWQPPQPEAATSPPAQGGAFASLRERFLGRR